MARRLLRAFPWVLAVLIGFSPLLPPLLRTLEAQRLAGVNQTSGSLVNTNDALAIDVGLASTAVLNITGTWAGTILWEGTTDGTTWFAVSGTTLPTGGTVASTTANGQWRFSLSGLYRMRARLSVATSGTATLNFSGSTGADPIVMPGATLSALTIGVTRPYPVKATPGQVWGVFGSNLSIGMPCTLNLYDAAVGDVTVGTTVPRLTFYLPASGTTIMLPATQGVDFTTAITVANSVPRTAPAGTLQSAHCPQTGTLQHSPVDATILYK